MTALPRGATGFWDAAKGRPAHTDVRAFRRAAHTATHQLACQVETFEPAGVTPNFHLMIIRTAEDGLGVVCHELLPWLAIVRPPDGAMEPLTFRSDPALAAALERVPPFRVLDPTTLATPLTRLDLSALDHVEREQIAFWKPENLAQLLFNWWD